MRLPARLVETALYVAVRPVLGPPVPLPVQRRWLELCATGSPLPAGTTVQQTVLGGRPAERVAGAGAADAGAVLLLHGGAFVAGSPRTHRVLAAHLAAASGAPVHVLDYRLAPEHPWPAAVDDAVAAYDELAATGPVVVVGDSAGGCLAALLLRQRRPVAVALVSPLVDLTRQTSAAWPGRDALVRADWARAGTQAFVGGADAPALSPLHDDLTSWPPLLVHVSEHERLRPEGEQLAERARLAGVDVELVVLPGLWHDAHLLSHLVGEAADASAALGRWVGRHLRP